MRDWFCLLNRFNGRPTIFGVLLQVSQNDYRCGWQTRECWVQWNSRQDAGHALYLGDRLNTRRRLGGFSLLSTIRCQTKLTVGQTITIPPTLASGDGTAVLVPVHQKDGRFHHFENPVHALLKILGQAQSMDCSPGESFGRSILSHYGISCQQNLVNSFIYVRVSHLATLEWSWLLPGSSLSPLALKQQLTSTSHHGWLLNCGNYTDLQMELLPYAASSTGTWVNQLVTLVQQLGWCRTTTSSNLEQLGTLSTCGNCYVVVKRYCVPRIYLSESVVFHLDFWVSSSVACFLVCVCVWGLFCFGFGKTPGFLLFTCSLTTWE